MNQPHDTPKPGRERFGTRAGFVLAAVGSAVGLGNMWRFPYQTAEGGGAAFLVAYVFMAFLIGVPMMLAEFAVGRRARSSAIGALRSVGGGRWAVLGLLFLVTSTMILAYLSVITGWALRYALDGLTTGFHADAAGRYAAIASGPSAVVFHLVSIGATVSIVVFGVRKGIERASMLLMPLLFVLLIGLAVWAATLPGAAEGYRFYLSPSLGELLNPVVLQGAAAHAFYSLSVGMGIMITYSSYLSRTANLGRESAVIALSDFSVAFVAGLVVFPIVFGLGLSEDVGESTLGVLFISLPSAFAQMEVLGRIVGTLFFIAVIVAAITSAVSLLEVAASMLIDEWKWTRRRATLTSGILVAAIGIVPALSLGALGVMDQIGAELLTVLGVLAMAVLVGWVMKNPEDELRIGSSPAFMRLIPVARFLIRYVAPPLLAYVSWIALRQTIRVLGGG
ncbi:sodium-dependent transporter [Candidatus Palauibacter sp.]|uniref:sodium-dependent transporter n=1 Tax=Candidatus Palauibacter sp. TaxID=3101350 RepID=UPI003AF24E33